MAACVPCCAAGTTTRKMRAKTSSNFAWRKLHVKWKHENAMGKRMLHTTRLCSRSSTRSPRKRLLLHLRCCMPQFLFFSVARIGLHRHRDQQIAAFDRSVPALTHVHPCTALRTGLSTSGFPPDLEFSPRDTLELYDTMRTVLRDWTAKTKESKDKDKDAQFAALETKLAALNPDTYFGYSLTFLTVLF